MSKKVNYSAYEKKFIFPSGFKPVKQLVFKDLRARPLARQDLQADLYAVNSSTEIILKTRGGNWPKEQISEEYDLLDLAWHECEFRNGSSFAYVIYNTNNAYIGCFYLYPMGHRSELTEELLSYDVDASWWVSLEAYEQGYYAKLYEALQKWLNSSFPFENIYYSNIDIPA